MSSRKVPWLHLAIPTYRGLKSYYVAGLPVYRSLITTTQGYATADAHPATQLDASMNPETEAREVKFKLAKKENARRLVPPKRPWSIMQLVIQDVMAEQKSVTGALTSSNTRECFRLAGERYRSLNEDEKKSYQAELDRRRQVYEVEMRKFLDSLTPQDYVNQNEYIRRRRAQGRSATRRGIPKFDPNAPKRPLNAFLLFCADLRANPSKFSDFSGLANIPSNSVGDGSKLIAAYWREMKEDVKQGYLLEAQRLRELYKQEREQYASQNGMKA
ncbi:hypothetical protein CROQUDRAFT_666137 [Cronartium quercuum f. sp. fusiforme G11]|uniref:HMG box domain-containing protein n=1 Tax=Cronartium quercuum f. sp. fusiforme G11 TaxID=708437 RepID=A0A9P6N625_9BASI|nr:hypothetical protein CROQUDRAFT_666137 [Cronartium quercuum f. sp. fusiforme G11]